jgi:hypothetical protein
VIWAKNFFNINPGLELPVSYIFFNTGTGEQSHLLTFGLNLTALKRLPEGNLDPHGSRRRVPGNRTERVPAEQVPAALTFRLGAGYGLLFTDAAHITAGVSFLLFVTDNLYLETGLDYAHRFTSPASYYFRPGIGIGFRK